MRSFVAGPPGLYQGKASGEGGERGASTEDSRARVGVEAHAAFSGRFVGAEKVSIECCCG
jgi:hypothetical protein